jgi:hypothetical protein
MEAVWDFSSDVLEFAAAKLGFLAILAARTRWKPGTVFETDGRVGEADQAPKRPE